jgi:hypothetical protein
MAHNGYPAPQFLLPMFNGAVANASRFGLGADYKRKTTLMHFERHLFDQHCSEAAREDLDDACCFLLGLWREYRERERALGLSITLSARIARYQKATFFQLIVHADGRREPNVYDRTCWLDLVVKRLCPHFERDLIPKIASFLLPGVQQHSTYYGFAGNTEPAAIDCTYVQPLIEGEVCTKAEHLDHAMVHADDLLEDGWDAVSHDDEEWGYELQV